MDGSVLSHRGNEPMEPERASEKQLQYLRQLPKARGARDNDHDSLIDRVYPQGLTKHQASDEIDKLKYLNGLPARWIHAYVRQLRQRHGLSVAVIMEYLVATCDGATQPGGLSRWQQQELIEWIATQGRHSQS